MKKLLALLLLLPGCLPGHYKPTPFVPDEELYVHAMEHGTLCGSSPQGTPVIADGTPCPDMKSIGFITTEIARKFHIAKDPRWERQALIYVPQKIKCEGAAMGCTVRLTGDHSYSIVSTYYPWVMATTRHELTHVAYFLTKADAMRDFCLDNPSMCGDNEEGTLVFP